MRRLKIWFKVIFSFFASIACCKKARILDVDKTIEVILKEKKSVIRLGDGEFNILQGEDVHYQKHSKELQLKMECLINEYLSNPEKSEYILCMPGEFLKCSGIKLLRRKVYIVSWAISRYIFKKIYDRKVTYGEAFLFGKGNEEKYKKIWLDSNIENIIFVHNEKRYSEEFEKKYNIKTKNILVKSKNSFENHEEILNSILKEIKNDKTMVLISAGPCAKYLVYELTKKGIWAIDTGHCWDSPLHLRDKL